MFQRGRVLRVGDWIHVGLELLLYLLVFVGTVLLLNIVEVSQQLLKVYVSGEVTWQFLRTSVSGLWKRKKIRYIK